MSNIEQFNNYLIKTKISKLKSEISKYDYIGVKIATGCASREEYAEQIAKAEELRLQIRELEAKLVK